MSRALRYHQWHSTSTQRSVGTNRGHQKALRAHQVSALRVHQWHSEIIRRHPGLIIWHSLCHWSSIGTHKSHQGALRDDLWHSGIISRHSGLISKQPGIINRHSERITGSTQISSVTLRNRQHRHSVRAYQWHSKISRHSERINEQWALRYHQ